MTSVQFSLKNHSTLLHACLFACVYISVSVTPDRESGGFVCLCLFCVCICVYATPHRESGGFVCLCLFEFVFVCMLLLMLNRMWGVCEPLCLFVFVFVCLLLLVHTLIASLIRFYHCSLSSARK